MNIVLSPLLAMALLAGVASASLGAESEPLQAASPNREATVVVKLDAEGRPGFEIAYRGEIVAKGSLGLQFLGAPLLQANMRVARMRQRPHDEVYAIPVGKTSSARDRHHELTLFLEERNEPRRRLEVEFRLFDDGVAFRYVVPEQPAIGEFILTDELTTLAFSPLATAHVLPLNGYTTSYEKYYETKQASEIAADELAGLPLLLECPAGDGKKAWVAVTEANLVDYAGMYLAGAAADPGALVSKLSPLPGRQDGAKVLGSAPFKSPWRVVMLADDPGRLIESDIIFHLSDPPAIDDVSWIKPGKTTFPWWNGYVLEGVDFEPGVNAATMKHYIDFCAEQGIPYHSLDGLDIAWYGGPIAPSGPVDVTKAAPSIDLPELLRYAKEKGVRLRLWMHWKALQPQIDEAFAAYEKWGIEGVMVDFMDRDDQEMVRFYHEMAEKAAKHRLTVTLHGAYKPTGMERTWPNVLTYEAALNQEYNKWQPAGVRGTPPKHNLDIAFIRMLAGPLDYHQGGMRNFLPEDYQWRDKAPPVQGTRGHQLAMYVVYQNHLSMMADYPAAYRGQEGLQFMVDVPATWDETRVLHAEFGKCLVIARRSGDAWYLGGMTAEEPCELNLDLSFLGGPHDIELYLDKPDDPTAVVRMKRPLEAEALKVSIPRDGGFAARVTPAKE